MATNQLMHGLRRQYAKTLGLIEAGGDPALTEDLAALAHVIRLFDPLADMTAILPVRPYRAARRHWSRTAMETLRSANGPMTVRELAERVLAARGEPSMWANLQGVEASLCAVLERLERRELISGAGRPKAWGVRDQLT